MALCEVRIVTERMGQSNEYGTKETINSIGTGQSGIVIENQEKNISLVYLKYLNAILGTLDCEARGISRDVIVSPASVGFVSTSTNLIITGA